MNVHWSTLYQWNIHNQVPTLFQNEIPGLLQGQNKVLQGLWNRYLVYQKVFLWWNKLLYINNPSTHPCISLQYNNSPSLPYLQRFQSMAWGQPAYLTVSIPSYRPSRLLNHFRIPRGSNWLHGGSLTHLTVSIPSYHLNRLLNHWLRL